MAKILYIGDQEHIEFLLTEELTEAGYQVVTSSDSNNIMKEIEVINPDLIILDRDFEKGDSFEILSNLRSTYYTIPIILYSAYDTFEENMRTIAADFYIIKSFDLTELKKKIAMALEVSYQDYETTEDRKAKTTEMVTARIAELINY